MYLVELANPKQLKTHLEYHATLNPKLWSTFADDKNYPMLKPEVQEALEKISNAFLAFLKVEADKVADIIFTGSNANYNWSKLSDIDLHIILNYDAICKDCQENSSGFDLDDCYKAKKTVWNEYHDITIKDYIVEVYVEPKTEERSGNAGVWSLVKKDWIKVPQKEEDLVYDETQIKAKAADLMHQIDMLSKESDATAIKAMQDKIKKMRQAAISSGGEFSLENLVFKAIRNNGYMDKLYDLGNKAEDDELSLK